MPWDLELATRLITLLNEALALDPKAIEALVETRVPCNDALADHPTIQVSVEPGSDAKVGLLGILNGLCGTDASGWGPLAAEFDDSGNLSKFCLWSSAKKDGSSSVT